jgi:hypothetical protein
MVGTFAYWQNYYYYYYYVSGDFCLNNKQLNQV